MFANAGRGRASNFAWPCLYTAQGVAFMAFIAGPIEKFECRLTGIRPEGRPALRPERPLIYALSLMDEIAKNVALPPITELPVLPFSDFP